MMSTWRPMTSTRPASATITSRSLTLRPPPGSDVALRTVIRTSHASCGLACAGIADGRSVGAYGHATLQGRPALRLLRRPGAVCISSQPAAASVGAERACKHPLTSAPSWPARLPAQMQRTWILWRSDCEVCCSQIKSTCDASHLPGASSALSGRATDPPSRIPPGTLGTAGPRSPPRGLAARRVLPGACRQAPASLASTAARPDTRGRNVVVGGRSRAVVDALDLGPAHLLV